jgi:hypothetical protein
MLDRYIHGVSAGAGETPLHALVENVTASLARHFVQALARRLALHAIRCARQIDQAATLLVALSDTIWTHTSAGWHIGQLPPHSISASTSAS